MQISVNGTDVFGAGAFKPGVAGVTFVDESGGYVKLALEPGKWNVVAKGAASR